MKEPGTITLYCTGCRRQVPHAFVSLTDGLIRYQCQPCGRTKLLVATEKRA